MKLGSDAGLLTSTSLRSGMSLSRPDCYGSRYLSVTAVPARHVRPVTRLIFPRFDPWVCGLRKRSSVTGGGTGRARPEPASSGLIIGRAVGQVDPATAPNRLSYSQWQQAARSILEGSAHAHPA
jgi:hypothetical protein